MRKRYSLFIAQAILAGAMLVGLSSCSNMDLSDLNPFSQDASVPTVLLDVQNVATLQRNVGTDLENLHVRLAKAPKGKYSANQVQSMSNALNLFDKTYAKWTEMLSGGSGKVIAISLVDFYGLYGDSRKTYIAVKDDIGPLVYGDDQLDAIDRRFVSLDKSIVRLNEQIGLGKNVNITPQVKTLLTTMRMAFDLKV